MKIKELKDEHPRIYELAILRQKEAGNEANEELFLSEFPYSGGFDWKKTQEGREFWGNINNGNFSVFYQKYPEKSTGVPTMRNPPPPPKIQKISEMPKPLVEGSTISTPPYYDNSKSSLYKVATERNWNAYLFDVVKRLERGGKKDPLKQEIEKSIAVLQIWLKELD